VARQAKTQRVVGAVRICRHNIHAKALHSMGMKVDSRIAVERDRQRNSVDENTAF
jgi:hypothetical protein